jgi:hypothetical protein
MEERKKWLKDAKSYHFTKPRSRLGHKRANSEIEGAPKQGDGGLLIRDSSQPVINLSTGDHWAAALGHSSQEIFWGEIKTRILLAADFSAPRAPPGKEIVDCPRL